MFHYFTDPVLQAPTLGSILMCYSSSLVGVIVFLRKRSLLGEALSHAAYPGVVIACLLMSLFFPKSFEFATGAILIGAFVSCLLGFWVIEILGNKWRVKADAALCFVLSAFFGVGILIASQIQFTHALWYKMVQLFLYGQVATMTDIHVVIYAALALLISIIFIFFYRPIKMAIFDRGYSGTVGLPIRFIDNLLFFLLVLAIVIGIRSVGVVLMAGMLIAPVVCARYLSNSFSTLLLLSGAIGGLSGFLGNYFSVEMPAWGGWNISLPTGPMILLSASLLCLLSLLFAPQRGIVCRCVRILQFSAQCREDHFLKDLWREQEIQAPAPVDKNFFTLHRLKRQGWIEKTKTGVKLTKEGYQRASRIVRLHRLWEVYLVFLGQGVEKVHRSAEEMEHIITPQLEQELSELLGDPKYDPHAKPIPSKDFL